MTSSVSPAPAGAAPLASAASCSGSIMAYDSPTVRGFRLRSGKTWHQIASEDLARELAACYQRLEGLKRQIRTLEDLDRRRRAWERLG